MFTATEAAEAIRLSGVSAQLVPRFKGSTDPRYCLGIKYRLNGEIAMLSAAFVKVIGKERWNALMRVAQVDTLSAGRVLYFPGQELEK